MRAHFQTAVRRETRAYRCAQCGLEGEVSIAGIGEGASSSFNAPGTTARRARAAASKDVELTLGVFPCPKCGHRPAGAVRRWWVAYGLPLGAMVLFIAALGFLPYVIDVGMKDEDRGVAACVMVGTALFVSLPFLFTTWMKWKGAPRRVHFTAARPNL